MERDKGSIYFIEELVRYETLLWNALDRSLTSEGSASLATLLTLRHLEQRDGRGRVQDLATYLGVTVGAASKIVDRLERKGLVERRPHPDDRRSALISVTTDGARTMARSTAAAESTLAKLLPADARTDQLAQLIHSLLAEQQERRKEEAR